MPAKDTMNEKKIYLDALTQELGSVGTVYFLRQFKSGKGNWTEDRKQELAGLSIVDIENDVTELQKDNVFSHSNVTAIH